MIINSLQRHPFLRLLMPFAGGIVCGDAHFFRQWAELSLNIPAEASCPVSNLFPVWICLAGFMLLFLTYFL
ncbi:hypothetical protein, partial [Bacteroides cellulosilyticus]|uniref:hypothetical protein n=1 Tax=Bacteroides cellulosilyticus TaxID=246787 RepID=UPI001B7FE9C8